MESVLVTGAAGGMGNATCQKLVQNGYTVFAMDRKEVSLPGVIFVKADLTSEEDVKNAYQTIASKTKALYAVIHMAGMYDLGSLLEFTESEFEGLMRVNFFSAARVNRIFMPLMKQGSRFLLTSSELAPLRPLPFTGLYALSKTAIERYALSLRMEVQLLGMSVSVLRPGAVQTGLLDDSTRALERFTEETKLYSCNAARFRNIVDSVEERHIQPEKIAEIALKALESRRPRHVYSVNRNPLLLLLDLLPERARCAAIRLVLKP